MSTSTAPPEPAQMDLTRCKRSQPYEIYCAKDFATPIKLSVGEYDGELPKPVRETVIGYFAEHLESGCLRYPSDHSTVTRELKEAICRYNSMLSEDQVILTGGSTEALRLIFDTYLEDTDKVLFPIPSYSNALNLIRLRTRRVDTVLCLGFDMLCQALQKSPYKLVYLSQPNNPTGYVFSMDEMELLADRHPGTVFVLDGCYLEFDRHYSVYAMNRPNVIVVRTFSKAFGLAGLRIGYLYSRADVVARLALLRDPHLPSELAKVAALTALASLRQYEAIWEELSRTRVWLIDALQKIGLEVNPNARGMFVMAGLHEGTNKELCDFLREQHKILVKPLKGEVFGLEEARYVRIGMAGKETLQRLVKAIGAFYSQERRGASQLFPADCRRANPDICASR